MERASFSQNMNIENFNLHIKKTSAKDTFVATVKDDKRNVLASNKFQYHTDTYILSKLEDSVGRKIAQNSKLIREFGSELFKAVFASEVLGYYKSLSKKAKQIRLKLFFKKQEPELLRLPWEFMFDGTNFLSAYPRISISRVLEGIPSRDRGKIQGKIKILAVISSPLDLKDYQRLQIEREKVLILQAVDRAVAANRIEIDFEDESSLRNIQTRFDEESYHILHYTGHGEYSEKEHKAYLLLEDDSGNSRVVDNETIATLLSGYPSLRLVVLSGCQTAKTSGITAFSDLSTPLLRKGIPAVLSMQYSVSDESAMQLAKKLYTEISQGTPIDLALTKARKELLLNEGVGRVDFATPVLFSDNPDCLAAEEIRPPSEKEGFPIPEAIAYRKNIVLGLEQLGTQFIGRRKELRRVKEDFLSRGMRAVILHGIGGIGKTVTATKVVEKLQDFFAGIYAFDCIAGLRMEEVLLRLNEFLKRNGVDVLDNICTSEEPMEIKIGYLAQVLSQIKLLLIFDNFESLLLEEKNRWEISETDLKKGLKALITQCKDGSRFLFTSRYTFNLTDGRLTNVIDEINLGEFSQPEAIMVMNRFPEIAREEFSTKYEIYQKIGGNPYIINIFARQARVKSAKEVLMDIAEVTREMVEFTLLDKSYQSLCSRAKALIQRASLFKKAMPLAGLEWMMRSNGKSTAISKEINELVHWGLIIKIAEDPEALYQVHTLVKDFIKTKTDVRQWKKWLIKAAGFYENLFQTTRNLWDYLDARELYFDAGEYNKAGDIVWDVTEYLHRWGFIELVKRLNEQTINTASDSVKAAAFYNLGLTHQDQGEYEKAVEKYHQSLNIFEELGDKRAIAATLHQLGIIHQKQGEYEKAVEKYHQSLKIEEELGNKGGIATTLHQLGNIHYLQGDYGMAVEKYHQILNIFEELGDKAGIAQTLHQLGMIYQDQGEYKKAVEKYTQSLKIAEELGDKGGIAATINQLGNIHYLQGEYEKAVEKYHQSLKIREELGDKKGTAGSLHQLGTIHYMQGEYDKAVEKHHQSLKIAEEIGDKGGIAITLHGLGNIHYLQGEYEKAVENYNQSLKIKEELGDKGGIARTTAQLGRIYEAKEKFKEAIKNYMISLSIFEYLNSPEKYKVGALLNKIKNKIGEETFERYTKEIRKDLKGKGHE